MQRSLDRAIREQLTNYLAGKISLPEFEEWFVPATWAVEQSGNPTAEELTSQILLDLAEFSNGDWTEEELRDLFRPLVQPSEAVSGE